MAGRKSIYTKDVAKSFADKIASGHTIREICDTLAEKYPKLTPNVIYYWMRVHPEFSVMMTEARISQSISLMDEVIGIADSCDPPPPPRTTDPDSKLSQEQQPMSPKDRVAIARLKIDARKLIAEHYAPHLFGAQVRHEHTGRDGGPISVEQLMNDISGNKENSPLHKLREQNKDVL